MLATVHTHLSYLSHCYGCSPDKKPLKGDRVDEASSLERRSLAGLGEEGMTKECQAAGHTTFSLEAERGPPSLLFIHSPCVRVGLPTSISCVYKPLTVMPTGSAPWRF